MPDLYDRLIHALGLGHLRKDQLFGEPVSCIGVFQGSGTHTSREVRLNLCRLPDGQPQYIFEWTTTEPCVGILPATPANLARLRIFLAYGRAAEIPNPEAASSGWFKRLGQKLVGEELADLGRLPNESPHMGASLRIRRLPDGSRALVFRFHGRGWTDAVIAASPEHLAILDQAWSADASDPSLDV